MEEGTIVHVDYDLWNAETEDLIETTREAIAEEHGMDTTNRTFQPMVAIVGHGALIEGFEDALLEAEPDKDYSITIEPDKAYGEKDPNEVMTISQDKLMRYVCASEEPVPRGSDHDRRKDRDTLIPRRRSGSNRLQSPHGGPDTEVRLPHREGDR